MAAALLAGADPARATEIDGVFTAYVTYVSNTAVWNGAAIGDQITGAFKYDTAYLPANDPFCAAHGRGCYSANSPAHSFMSITMTLDGVTYDFADDQSTTLLIGDYIQTLPGYQFDQFTVGEIGDVTEIGGNAPGVHTGSGSGSAFVQAYPYRQIFTSGDPLQTFTITPADLRGASANTATLGGWVLEFSTTSMSDHVFVAGGVPEPATWTMMILGLGAIGARLRRRGVRPPPGAATA